MINLIKSWESWQLLDSWSPIVLLWSLGIYSAWSLCHIHAANFSHVFLSGLSPLRLSFWSVLSDLPHFVYPLIFCVFFFLIFISPSGSFPWICIFLSQSSNLFLVLCKYSVCCVHKSLEDYSLRYQLLIWTCFSCTAGFNFVFNWKP